jgi:predicted metalloprotease with PDZ domain
VVTRETPAWTAGVNVDDEILAINEFRVRPNQLDQRLDAYTPGEKVTLLVARRDELKRLEVVLGTAPDNAWQLELRPDITAGQRAHLTSWLTVESRQ